MEDVWALWSQVQCTQQSTDINFPAFRFLLCQLQIVESVESVTKYQICQSNLNPHTSAIKRNDKPCISNMNDSLNRIRSTEQHRAVCSRSKNCIERSQEKYREYVQLNF
eukprot:1158773-Pelagomonas_calceolata.AAC.16